MTSLYPDGKTGSATLEITNYPPSAPVDVLIGIDIWAGSGEVLIGDKVWAERRGTGEIILVNKAS